MKKTLTFLLVITFIFSASCAQEEEISYTVGEEVIFNEEEWYVLNINEEEDYLTLVSKDEIIVDSIYFDDELLFDMVRYFTDEKEAYVDSALYIYIEEEVIPTMDEDSLVAVDGYKVRLLNLEDIQQVMELTTLVDDNGLTYYQQASDGDYSWLVPTNSWYWTMIECEDEVDNVVYGESSSEKYLHFSWYIITNYNDCIEVTSIGTRTDDAIKLVANVVTSAVEKVAS